MNRKALVLLCCLFILSACVYPFMAAKQCDEKTYTQEQIYAKDVNAVVEIFASAPHDDVHINGGTGFFISDDGLIVTAAHVVYDEDYNEVSDVVFVHDTEKNFYMTRILRVDLEHDIALLQVTNRLKSHPKGYKSTSFQRDYRPLPKFDYLDLSHTSLQAGEQLTTIGYPGRFTLVVSTGILSTAKPQDMPMKAHKLVYPGVYLTGVPLFPGNSGGPMIDSRNKVVGVATLGVVTGVPFSFFQSESYIERLLTSSSFDTVVYKRVPYDNSYDD